MKRQGGQMFAASVDAPDKARDVMTKAKLAFPVLADESRAATQAFGVLHAQGSPEGKDVPIPSMFLINRDGKIIWQRVAKAVQDRPDPEDVIVAIRAAMKSGG